MTTLSSCKQEETCPFQPISQTNNLSETNSNIDSSYYSLVGTLEGQFLKFGLGEIDGKLQKEINNKVEIVTSKNLIYDSQTVIKWNTLTMEICGSLKILNEDISFSEEQKARLKNSILEKITTFYDKIIDKPIIEEVVDVQEDNDKPVISKKVKTKVEIPIQLEKRSKGYKKVFINNKPAKLGSNSTSFNPRANIFCFVEDFIEVKVITKSLDICIKDFVISNEHIENNLTNRIIIKCD